MAVIPLPDHPRRQYDAANVCIYCGATIDLRTEHIMPYALGGNWLFPKASCTDCGKKTSAFEGTCARSMLGPLRMLYGVQSRRMKDRPETSPLKVRRRPGENWTTVEIRRDEYPFVVVLPLYVMPDELTGGRQEVRNAATAKLWVKGAAGYLGMEQHLDVLARRLNVVQIEPVGETVNDVFCMMLAKIAHSFATAELGVGAFIPLVTHIVRDRDVSDRAQFIGGLPDEWTPSPDLHEIAFYPTDHTPDLVAVKVRPFACLGTPAYVVVVGRRAAISPARNATSSAQ